jgi:hypothetical protein
MDGRGEESDEAESQDDGDGVPGERFSLGHDERS